MKSIVDFTNELKAYFASKQALTTKYDQNNPTENDIHDADYIPFFYTSYGGKRNITWSNLKNDLKPEFATNALIAPVENGTNYSDSYSQGQPFIRFGVLKVVTATTVGTSTAISSGNCADADYLASQVYNLQYNIGDVISLSESDFFPTVINGAKTAVRLSVPLIKPLNSDVTGATVNLTYVEIRGYGIDDIITNNLQSATITINNGHPFLNMLVTIDLSNYTAGGVYIFGLRGTITFT